MRKMKKQNGWHILPIREDDITTNKKISQTFCKRFLFMVLALLYNDISSILIQLTIPNICIVDYSVLRNDAKYSYYSAYLIKSLKNTSQPKYMIYDNM